MFVGGCSGSTSGAIKMMRILLLQKMLRREMTLAIHPHEVIPVRFNGRVVNERTLRPLSVSC